ncbi:MAG: trypsin-like peptidase domain-containing protein [Sandaracinaceae bacterium]|nr:trypsin-like peptidase domain-containing protein [Sandaracinaceae bacterium]
MRWIRAGWLLGFGLAVACGGGDSSGGGDRTAGDEDEFEESGSMRALAEGEEAPAFPTSSIGDGASIEGDMSILRPRPAGAPPADTRDLYRQLAPATVIVRSATTMGTGVIVGPNGLILTNNHVIEHADYESFRMRVTVEYGAIGEAGSMIPDGQHRTAYVLKRDAHRDLALLRVVEPLEGRPIVSLAADDPSPGQVVTTLGHGNIGMVWAVRRCEVEATGRLEETYARLAAVCGSEDAQAASMCQTMRERMHEDMEGVVVQTSCPLSPGDSGGPLVDGQGALVGLNVMTISNQQGQHSNYHIHVRELRDFLVNVPGEPIADVPTPFIEHQQIEEQDQDLDGRFDTVFMRSGETTSSLVDLDQDSPDGSVSNLEQRVASHGFDAEVAVVTRFPHTFVWYDTNNDGTLDLVLSLDARQRVEAAHTVQGTTVTETQVPAGPGLMAARVPTAMRARFERIFHAQLSDNPDPMPALLRRGEVTDADHDGVMDTVHGQRGLVHAVAFDLDQNSTRGVTTESADEFVRSGALDAEFTMVYRDPTLYTYYDRDNDGAFDIGLRCAPSSSVIAAVVPVNGSSPLNPDDVIGTLGIRGDFAGSFGAQLRTMAVPHVVDSWIAYEEDVGGLPDPVGHHRNLRVTASFHEDGWDNFVLRTEDDGYITSLVDVDRSSWRGRNRQYREDLNAAVREHHFSADFAVISNRVSFWAWYDRDHDGTWDTVLVQVTDTPDVLHNAFVRQGAGWVHDAALVAGAPIRPELIRRQDRARFDSFVRRYFSERYVTPAATPSTASR